MTPKPQVPFHSTIVAGTWNVTVMSQDSDSVLITYVLNATATTDGWTSMLPGRDPMPVRVVLVDGDSVVTEAGTVRKRPASGAKRFRRGRSIACRTT